MDIAEGLFVGLGACTTPRGLPTTMRIFRSAFAHTCLQCSHDVFRAELEGQLTEAFARIRRRYGRYA